MPVQLVGDEMKSEFATPNSITASFLEYDKLYLVAGYSDKTRVGDFILEPVISYIAVKLRTPYSKEVEDKILIVGHFTNNDFKKFLFSILPADDYVYVEFSKNTFVSIKQ